MHQSLMIVETTSTGFIRFVKIHAFERRTETQMDRQTDRETFSS